MRAYPAGTIVGGRYEIVALRGRGQQSLLYDARQRSTRQDVVVKVLAVDPDSLEDSRARFEREIRVLSHLTSGHTVRLLDAGENVDGNVFMALERLDGVPLSAVLKRATKRGLPIPAMAVGQLLVPLLRALGEAHQKGLVHRNLLPSHIMLCRAGIDEFNVKVLDYGIVRSVTSTLTRQGAAVGTPAYMSPEQARGEDLDQRTDLYGLGVLLYRCLEGRLPFDDPDVFEVIRAHVLDPIPRMASSRGNVIASKLAALTAQMLSKSPDDRPEDAEAVLREVRGILGRRDPGLDDLRQFVDGLYDASTRPSGQRPALVVQSAPQSSPPGTPPPAPNDDTPAVDHKATRIAKPKAQQGAPNRPRIKQSSDPLAGAFGPTKKLGQHPVEFVDGGEVVAERREQPVAINHRQRLKGLKEAVQWVTDDDPGGTAAGKTKK